MISVIVPVYKVEPYLRRCVDSVLNQTYQNFEIILVDDGSPDNCGAICDEYAAADSRVRVFHKENGGVSSARNMGLDRAKGEFVAFLDSDDWYHPQMLELLSRAAEEFGADGITVANLWAETDEIPMSAVEYVGVGKHAYQAETIRGDIYRLAYGAGKVKDTLTCGLYGMYRAACFEGIRFDSAIACGEDILVLFQLNLRVEKVVHLDVPLYYYYTGNQSAMRCGLTKNKLTMLNALLRIAEALEPLPEQAWKIEYRYLYYCLDFQLQAERTDKPELRQAMEAHRQELKRQFGRLRRNPYLSAMERLAVRLYVMGIPAYRKCFGKVAPAMEKKLQSFVTQ